MIQIQSAKQFERAAERLRTERQSIRKHESGLWLVTNLTKNNTYAVRIERKDGLSFITCGCEAGSPRKGNRAPMVCKHAAALIIYLRGLREMRRRANA
jgi:hypothetical protein